MIDDIPTKLYGAIYGPARAFLTECLIHSQIVYGSNGGDLFSENGAIFTFFAFLVNGVNVVGVVTPNDRKGEETLRILGRAGERGESRREVRWTSSSPSWNVKWDKCIH